jgi:8-oxo-dGTP pyrophosphatase MutT (NUDIX family)
MEGLTKADVDKAEAADFAKVAGPSLRPRDAATLMLLDRQSDGVHVLMGRRSARHAFMPGRFVFPGGRTDPSDSRVPVASPLDPAEEAKLVGSGARASRARARAIALSAIRETYEEAGLLIGRSGPFATTKADWQGFVEHGVAPSLEGLRYVARAVTPPGRVRRFDTRFLAAWRGSVALSLPEGGPTQELEELVWLPLADAAALDVPLITRTILRELQNRLADDPDLRPGAPVPFFRLRGNSFLRDLL